ncbi:MAG: phosphoserine phosphatase SerB [Neisseriaceae bacterium]|nr:phosphoserine phosphatase SerB [Neisseriaceae bacterium]MBP6861488.1 phosphoserine phosphatase SerB [Neisseriaceae bacterium]
MKHALVLQHPQLAQIDLSWLWADLNLTPAASSDGVIRLVQAQPFALSDAHKQRLHDLKVEVACLPNQALSDIGLMVSDMDSTLITIECIDEIADQMGIKAQIAAITERAMQGELDFRASLIERVALLKGLPESALAEVYEHKLTLTPGAETLVQTATAHGIKFMLVSGGFTFFTDRLKARLGLDYAYANELEIVDGVLTGKVIGDIIDAEAKARLLRQHRDELGLKPEQVIAMGDGANDIPMLEAAGIGVAFHAKEKTKSHATLCLDHYGLDQISPCFG